MNQTFINNIRTEQEKNTSLTTQLLTSNTVLAELISKCDHKDASNNSQIKVVEGVQNTLMCDICKKTFVYN